MICCRYAVMLLFIKITGIIILEGLPSSCFKHREKNYYLLVKRQRLHVRATTWAFQTLFYGFQLHLTPLTLTHTPPKCHASRTFQSSISGPVPCAWVLSFWGMWQARARLLSSAVSCVCLSFANQFYNPLPLCFSLPPILVFSSHRVAVRGEEREREREMMQGFIVL